MAVLPVSRAIRGTTLLCFDSLVCLELGQRRRLRGLGRGTYDPGLSDERLWPHVRV